MRSITVLNKFLRGKNQSRGWSAGNEELKFI